MGDSTIPNSASHHFCTIFFLEKQTKKPLLRYVFFYIYLVTCKTYTVLKQSSDYSSIFCPECVDLQTTRTVLDNLTLF